MRSAQWQAALPDAPSAAAAYSWRPDTSFPALHDLIRAGNSDSIVFIIIPICWCCKLHSLIRNSILHSRDGETSVSPARRREEREGPERPYTYTQWRLSAQDGRHPFHPEATESAADDFIGYINKIDTLYNTIYAPQPWEE